jgi:hypothetical protein
MSKRVAQESRRGGRRRDRRDRRALLATAVEPDRRSGEVRTGHDRLETVMKAAERSGLLTKKSSRIAGRVSPTLVRQAKKRTGIRTDTDLIEFALANVALEDNFADAFKAARGKVDGKLELGF